MPRRDPFGTSKKDRDAGLNNADVSEKDGDAGLNNTNAPKGSLWDKQKR